MSLKSKRKQLDGEFILVIDKLLTNLSDSGSLFRLILSFKGKTLYSSTVKADIFTVFRHCVVSLFNYGPEYIYLVVTDLKTQRVFVVKIVSDVLT